MRDLLRRTCPARYTLVLSPQNYGGFAGGPELLVVVNAETYEPKLLFPTDTIEECDEDSSIKVRGFEVRPNAARRTSRAHVLKCVNAKSGADLFVRLSILYTYTCIL